MSAPLSLWIDAADAQAQLAARERAGSVAPALASKVRSFLDNGFLVGELDVEEGLLDQIVEDAAQLWKSQPADLAYAYDSAPRSMRFANEAEHRKPRSRIHDLHSHSMAALELYLKPQLFELVELLFGQSAVAIQSLYFEYGSQQLLHRDPVVVPTGSPSHLLAAWIALEDIHPESGALLYVPGSHRLPYYEFEPGQIMFDGSRMGAAEVEAATAFDDEQARRHGLEPRLFTPRKGQFLLWHAALRHGGGPVSSEPLTRKSFVIHYSCAATYEERSITIEEPMGPASWQPLVQTTRRQYERAACRGFANPMESYIPSSSNADS